MDLFLFVNDVQNKFKELLLKEDDCDQLTSNDQVCFETCYEKAFLKLYEKLKSDHHTIGKSVGFIIDKGGEKRNLCIEF